MALREGDQRGDPQQGVGGDGDCGQVLVGGNGADMGVSGANEVFFVAKVDLDAPAPKVALEEFFETHVRVGAEEIGGLAVKESGAFAQSVAEWGDDNKPQGQVGSGLAPEDWAEGFDAELVMATGGEGTDGLPGNGVVGTKGFGGRGGVSIAARAAVSGSFGSFGEVVEDGVFAGTTDVNASGGKATDNGFVGEAAVASEDDAPICGNFFAQLLEAQQCLCVEVLLFEGFAVGGGGGGIDGSFLGLDGAGGVEEVDGNHAGFPGWCAIHIAQGPGGGELEVALGLDEIGLKSGAERVALPAAAVDFFAGFAHDGVIKGDYEGFAGSEVFKQWLAGLVEEVRFLDAVLGVESVIGGPVAVLATMGANEIGDGAFIRSEKSAEHVPGEYFGAAFGGGSEVAGGADEFLKALAQERI